MATISSGATIQSEAQIVAGIITNTSISASAGIAWNKMAALTSAHLLVGNASNVATDVAITGDVTISNAGITTIGASKVTLAMMANLTSANFIVGDGTNRPASVTMSNDATMANTGAVTIARGLKFLAQQTWTNVTTGTSFTGLTGDRTYYLTIAVTRTATANLDMIELRFNGVSTASYNYTYYTDTTVASVASATQIVVMHTTGTTGTQAATAELLILARSNNLGNVGVAIMGNGCGANNNDQCLLKGNFTSMVNITSIDLFSVPSTTGIANLYEVMPA